MQNRFRIGLHGGTELPLIFFREYGSSSYCISIGLMAVKFSIWLPMATRFVLFDSSTYDMISLKKPTPGFPGRAIGQYSPDSPSSWWLVNIALHSDPLPKIIFSGENSETNRFFNQSGVNLLIYEEFLDRVSLNIEIISTNNLL